MMFSSIRIKLTLWYVGILAAFILLFAGVTYYALIRSLDRDLNESLAEMGQNFSASLAAEQKDLEHEKLEQKNEEQEDPYLESEGKDIIQETAGEMRFRDYQFIVYSADGAVKATTTDFNFAFDELQTHESYGDINVGGKSFRLYRTSVSYDSETLHLYVFHSLDEQDAVKSQLTRIFLIGLPFTLLLAGFGGYYLARKSLAPMVDLSRQADRIGAENLGKLLTVRNDRDELGQLAAVFNNMLARLNTSFEQQRRFMADASHELRTPLAIIRGESEVTLSKTDRENEDYRESLAVVHDESKRLSRIVEDLFTIARADSGQLRANFNAVYIDEIVADAVRSIGVLARKKSVKIVIEQSLEMPMNADESLLRRLFLNLLDNAVKYSRTGGYISVACENIGGNYSVTITDGGIGIPTEEQKNIFKRFYRVDKARSRSKETETSGAGLGLSIAKRIAEIHGGDVTLVSSDKRGSVFSVTLAC